MFLWLRTPYFCCDQIVLLYFMCSCNTHNHLLFLQYFSFLFRRQTGRVCSRLSPRLGTRYVFHHTRLVKSLTDHSLLTPSGWQLHLSATLTLQAVCQIWLSIGQRLVWKACLHITTLCPSEHVRAALTPKTGLPWEH